MHTLNGIIRLNGSFRIVLILSIL